MRPSLRFLTIAVVGWTGLRAAMLGALPGADLFTIRPAAADVPAMTPTQFPAIEQLPPADPAAAAMMQAAALPALYPAGPYAGTAAPYPLVVRPSYAPPPYARRFAASAPASAPYYVPAAFAEPLEPTEPYPYSRLAAVAYAPLAQPPTFAGTSVPESMRAQALDRLQLTAWAMLRGRQGLRSSPASLASGGTLGGSQGGARLTYNFTRQVAATLRVTNTVGQRGGEVALGARVQPLRSIPVWVTAERRQALGKYGGGRNAFALFFEGGVWNRPLPLDFRLDAYLQGGVVGFKSRDGFVDGAATATRPVYRNFSAGLGVWGAAQPGVYRVDAGPRVTMKVRDNIKVHVDYRQRLAGNAEPGSGPVLTLAGDF